MVTSLIDISNQKSVFDGAALAQESTTQNIIIRVFSGCAITKTVPVNTDAGPEKLRRLSLTTCHD